MKQSYSDIRNQFLRNIGKAGSTDTNILADFNNNLSQRYQMVMAKMKDYMTQQTVTGSTVASQQYYAYPKNIVNVETIVVTVGGVNYPLTLVNAQHKWNQFNAIPIQPSAIPQFFFPRTSDFGIWPIPQAAYPITLNYHLRDRNLSVDDYTTGTIAINNGATTVTGSGTTFTEAMVGRWLVVTDTTKPGQGYWYLINGYTSVGVITLNQSWQDNSITGATYRICEVPLIPEEGHQILVDGVTADFYSGFKDDLTQATWFNNKFWTGDGQNPSRRIGDKSVIAGLIGMINYYQDRNQSAIVRRGLKVNPWWSIQWGSTIS